MKSVYQKGAAMGFFKKLGLVGKVGGTIDWDITPAYTFTMFESWGGKDERIRNNDERFYYFFIDAWEEPPKLCLMERAVKYARVLAWIDAPQDLIDQCVAEQGKSMSLDRSYAVNDALQHWLIKNVIETDDDSLVIPIVTELEKEALESGLPSAGEPLPELKKVQLRNESIGIVEDAVGAIIKKGNFFDSENNPGGNFGSYLLDNGDGLTVTDAVTGLMWQRGGCDITSIRKVRKYIEQLNKDNFGGFSDWRLPTMEEALSLSMPEMNDKGLYIHPCFSKDQPFIFVSDWREPGGFWFMDYKQGTVFWASGTIPGGFGRVCRSI